MDSQKTLIDIALVAQQIVGTLARHTSHRTVESLQLEKVVVGARALLEASIKTSFLNDNRIDDRLTDWLSGNEPQVCLQTLKRMDAMLNGKCTQLRGGNFVKTPSFANSKDADNEAIRLFQIHEGYFYHLLMPTEVWNRETDSSRPHIPADHDPFRVERRIDNRNVPQTIRLGASRMPQDGETRKQEIDAEKLRHILGWLNAWSCEDTHRRTTRLRQPDTCIWLPKTNEFKTWRSTENSFLWLHGKAGAGKSVLAAFLIDNLTDALGDGEILAFFYCDFRSERSTSAAEVMRSLLSQLLREFSWNAADHGDLIDKVVKQSEGGSSTVNDVMLLASYISQVVDRSSQRPYIVVDALDECDDVEELLNALTDLSKSNLRLLVTSRPRQVIKDSLSALPSISMDTMKYEVMLDVKTHITRVLDSHRRLRIMDNNLKKEIYSTLSQKADGMFRWVQCQLDILKRCMTPARIREALENLPDDLDATYARILLRIDKTEEEEIVRKALEWLVAALKPLQLSQLIEALSIDLKHQVLDHTCGPVHGPALLDALDSLVTYDELTDAIILSHFSVKEYLTGESTRMRFPTYHINQQAAHAQLALHCMCYITAHFKLSQQSVDYASSLVNGASSEDHDIAVGCSVEYPEDRFRLSTSHPLLEYVLSSGFRHLSNINPRNHVILQAIIDFVSEAQRNALEWERLCDDHYLWPRILRHDLVLYILITFAPEPMLRFYLGSAKPKLKDGTNPLIYAAYSSKIEHCRTLLSRGVRLNRRGWDIHSSRQLFPLEVALRPLGSIDVVDLFLKAESPVPQEFFIAALNQRASRFPSSNVARLLQTDEFVEWAATIQNEELLLRALSPDQYNYFSDGSRLSEKDTQVIRRRLIQLNCDPRIRFNEKSLYLAASAGQISIVQDMLSSGITLPHDIILRVSGGNFHPKAAMIQLLLDAGSNVHVTSPHGDTPLHHLVVGSGLFVGSPEADCLQSVQLLVGAGCDPSLYNLAEETPLHLAIERGFISVMEYLSSLHVPLPRDILQVGGWGALRFESTIRFLRKRGITVHAISASGDTSLHLVPFNCNWDEGLDCVKILVGAGCNPCLPNALGETTLHAAAKWSHLEVVQYLLSLNIPLPSGIIQAVCGNHQIRGTSAIIKFLVKKGVDIHSTSENGDNLLHLSMRVGLETECLRRVKLLCEAGCDVRARNLAGETPFHVAARFGHISVIEHLFSLGLSVPLDDMFITAILEGFMVPYHSRRTYYQGIIRFLLDKGLGVHMVGKGGKGLLHGAAAIRQEEDTLAVVKHLIHSGCDPSAVDLTQETPLHVAATHGNVSVLNYLLSLNPVFPPDILLAASRGGFKKTHVIRYLVDKGADASLATTDGDTPLHLLYRFTWGDDVETDRLECTKILVGAGCDPFAQNLAGETPLHTAARSGFVSVLKYFLSQDIPLPHDILSAARPVAARFFLQEMQDACCVSIRDDQELMHRILDFELRRSWDDEDQYASVECVRILVGLGWDPSLHNSSGETPMHIATRRGRTFVVSYLLSQKVPLPPDILLAAAAPSGSPHYLSPMLARLLIREGAGANVTAPNGDTPLHLALRHASTFDKDHYVHRTSWELVQVLLNSGSDPTARNMDGQTPLGMAKEKGHFFKENFLRLVRNSGHPHTLN